MKAIITCSLVWCVVNITSAQTTITTAQTGKWSNPATWNTNSVPNSNDNVIIATGDSVSVDSAYTCSNLTIQNEGKLNVDSAQSLSIAGNFLNNGRISSNYAVVQFNSFVTQTIGGSGNNEFFDLTINNSAGVTLTGSVKIKNSITVTTGTLYTGANKLSLLSDGNLTARVNPLASGADIQGDVSVQRYVNSSTMGWRFLGSPVKTTIADWSDNFITSGFPGSAYPGYYFCSIYGYDETTGGTSVNGYYTPSDVSDTLYPGIGYWVWLGASPTLIEVTGPLAKFTQNFNVSLTVSAGKQEDGWNLIANPYASPIDWDSPSWTKTGIQNAIYIWDPNNDQYTTYINGVSINGGSNVIASSQAFWVQANQNNPVLSCTEEVKTTSDVPVNKTTPKTIIRLAIAGNNYKDETVVCLSDNASNSVNAAEDAGKLFSDNTLVPSITSIADSSDLAINTLKFSSQEMKIPVRIKVGVSGVYTISRQPELLLPANACVFLEDKATGNYFDLRTSVSYTFQVNDTTNAPRFLLHISKPLSKEAINPTCSYKKDGKAIANITTNGVYNFIWKTNTGITLSSRKKVNGVDTLTNLLPGTYFVEVVGKENLCSGITETIVIGQIDPIKVKSKVSHVSCKNSANGSVQVQEVEGGTMPYTYQWADNSYKNLIKNLQPGNYSLITRDAWGCADTSSYEIKQLSNLQAGFEVVSDSNVFITGQPIHFINTSTDGLGYMWEFSGDYSYEINPVRTYTVAGVYTITLNTSDRKCISTTQRTVEIVNAKTTLQVIEKESAEEVTIYGSENSAIVKYNLPSETQSNIKILSAEGKVINTRSLVTTNGTEVMPLGQAHGIYIVQVTANGKNYINKLIN